MATLASILIPYGAGVTATLGGTTASSGIKLNRYAKFAINSTQVTTIVFYNSATPNADQPVPSATVGFSIPVGVTFTFDLGSAYDTFAIFNTSASSATYSYQQLQTVS